MRRIFRLPMLAVLATAATVTLVAAEDLRGIYDLALNNDSQFRAAEFTLEANREAKPLARSALLPQLTLSGAATHGDGDRFLNDYDTTSAQIDLTQPLFRRDSFMQYKQANNQVAQAEAQFSSEQQGLIMRVAQAYFDVLAAEDNLQFTRAETKAIYNQLDQAKQRYEVGLIAITDVHEAQASYDNARSNEIQATNELDNTREALRVIVGREFGNLSKLKSKIPLSKPNPASQDYWSGKVLENNPSVLAAKEAVEIARKEVEVQKSGHYPTLDLFAQKKETWNSPSGGLEDYDDEAIGLRLNMPLYTGGRTSSNVRRSRSQLKASLENYEAAKRSATRQVRDAYRGVESAISQVKALQASTVSAQSALDATTAGYEVGNRTLVDVLIAQRNLYQARSNYARSRYQYVLNGLYLKQAAGTLTAADLDSVNQLLK